jgi:pimeloyl-ACP methyl ester carboxylesterase
MRSRAERGRERAAQAPTPMPPHVLPFTAHGAGDPVLLIPDTGFPASAWDRFGHLPAAHHRVISYERRGFTPSAPQPADNIRAHAADAGSILLRADAIPADVIGWSGGGLVALALAVEHTIACQSLLLIEPSVHGLRAVTASALAMTLRAQAMRLLRGQRAATDLTYRWTFTRHGHQPSGWDEMPDHWREHVLTYAPAVAAEQNQATTLRYPPRRALTNLDQPTTIVIGQDSPSYFHRIADHLNQLLPHSQLHRIPNAVTRSTSTHPTHTSHSPAELRTTLSLPLDSTLATDIGATRRPLPASRIADSAWQNLRRRTRYRVNHPAISAGPRVTQRRRFGPLHQRCAPSEGTRAERTLSVVPG